MLPSLVKDNGTAACLYFRLAEWLVCPILFPDIVVQEKRFYEYLVGIERMGAALDAALLKIKGSEPRSPAVLRSQLRLAAEQDKRDRGDGFFFLLKALERGTAERWSALRSC